MKIFVTVGAQMPFDRLIEAVDRWAADRPQHQVVAQIHKDSQLAPRHIDAKRFLPPPEFTRACQDADALVGHAGIGTLFAALELNKSIVVLPREEARRETRNDHQLATARRFERFPGVFVAWTDDELPGKLDDLTEARHESGFKPVADGPLIDRLKLFIDAD